MFRSVSMLGVCLLAVAAAAVGQESKADIALSGFAAFSKDTSGNNIDQTATNSGGVLVSFRHSLYGHSGVEFNYGRTRNSQLYTNTSSLAFNEQQANVHELTGAYVAQLSRKRKLNPFVLGGAGILIFRPTSTSALGLQNASTDVKGTFLYGAGVNYGLMHGLGLRVQFRGLFYKSPDYGVKAVSTNSWAHTVEPSVGITWHF